MKKNVIIAVLIVITFMSLVYAFFQQTTANKARIEAENNLVLAKMEAERANNEAAATYKAQKEAELARAAGEAQRKIAEDCKKRK